MHRLEEQRDAAKAHVDTLNERLATADAERKAAEAKLDKMKANLEVAQMDAEENNEELEELRCQFTNLETAKQDLENKVRQQRQISSLGGSPLLQLHRGTREHEKPCQSL